jgi:hypothetical protein
VKDYLFSSKNTGTNAFYCSNSISLRRFSGFSTFLYTAGTYPLLLGAGHGFSFR